MKKLLYLLIAFNFANINGMNSSYEVGRRVREARIKVRNARAEQQELSEFSRDSAPRQNTDSNAMSANAELFEAQTESDRLKRQQTRNTATLVSSKTITPEIPWRRALPLTMPSKVQRSLSQPVSKQQLHGLEFNR